MLPMTDYEECRRYARAFVNVTRNLALLQDEFREEFGLTVGELERRALDRRRMTTHAFPPPQPGAETRTRGKLAGYRERKGGHSVTPPQVKFFGRKALIRGCRGTIVSVKAVEGDELVGVAFFLRRRAGRAFIEEEQKYGRVKLSDVVLLKNVPGGDMEYTGGRVEGGVEGDGM